MDKRILEEYIDACEVIKEAEAEGKNAADSLEVRIIEALGGADNIETVTCCASRLRVTVKDDSLVAPDEAWKNFP